MTSAPEKNEATKWPLWYQRFMQPFIEESALWPVFLALWGHLVVALAAFLIHFYRQPTIVVGILGLWLTLISFKTVQFERTCSGKLGAISLTVGSTWVFGGIMALFVDYTGIY